MQLIAHIKGKIDLVYPKKYGIPTIIQDLMDSNVYSNPKFAMLKRMHKRRWGIPPKIILWELVERDKYYHLYLPRGCERDILKLSKRYGVPVDWIDETVCPLLRLKMSDPWERLDTFQKRALTKLLDYDYGCLEAPTGSGKSNILFSLIYYLQTPTLILVHTRELLKQTKERCDAWLGVDTGVLGGGKLNLKPITVGMVQTVHNLDMSRMSNTFGAVIVDEAHHGPCNTWSEILNQLPARYRYGFTATAWRKDKMEFLLWKVIGPVRWTVTKKQAIKAGRIIQPKIVQVHTDFKFPLVDVSMWGLMISSLMVDTDRNDLITETVTEYIKPNTRALILTDRIRHAKILARRLQRYEPALLIGTMDSKIRKEQMERIRKGIQLTIATTHLLGEGVDVPGWDVLFLVSPFSKGPRVLQALGRIMRTANNKKAALLVDFIDSHIPMLVRAAIGRQSLYSG